MPCKKCKDDKYMWGDTGECKYATKDECEKANPKKYSKMRPTPLGKKSYEEYAKELKEFNLSAEPKLEKVELGILQDGNKASNEIRANIKQAQDQMNDLGTFVSRVKSVTKIIEGIRNEIKKELNSYDSALKKVRDEKSDLFLTANKIQTGVRVLEGIAKNLSTIEKDMGISVPGLGDFNKLIAQAKAFDKTVEKAYNKASDLPERPSQSL